MLFVSHDRYFVNRVADHLLLFEPERVRVIEGNYDTYQMLWVGCAKPRRRPTEGARPAQDSPRSRRKQAKPEKPREKRPKKRRFPFRKVLDIEDEIFERETRIERVSTRACFSPAWSATASGCVRSRPQIEQEQAAIKNLYEHWDEATELNW